MSIRQLQLWGFQQSLLVLGEIIFRKAPIYKKRLLICAGAVVNQGISVSEDSVIGVEAVVTEDCNKVGIYIGVPMNFLKWNN